MQTHINFEVHKVESPSESQKYLEAGRKKFSKQCQILFDAMWRGERLTSLSCVQKYQILDARRRFCDLEENGVHISEKSIGNRYKERFFSEDDMVHNQIFKSTLP